MPLHVSQEVVEEGQSEYDRQGFPLEIAQSLKELGKVGVGHQAEHYNYAESKGDKQFRAEVLKRQGTIL